MTNVANYAHLRCKIFGLEIWQFKKEGRISCLSNMMQEDNTFRGDSELLVACFTHLTYFLLKCNCNWKCHISRVLKLHLETRHPVWINAAHNEQLTQPLVHFCTCVVLHIGNRWAPCLLGTREVSHNKNAFLGLSSCWWHHTITHIKVEKKGFENT